jgi:hypothetical protein
MCACNPAITHLSNAVQFQKQSGGGGIDNNINDSICEVLEGGGKPTGGFSCQWFRFRLRMPGCTASMAAAGMCVILRGTGVDQQSLQAGCRFYYSSATVCALQLL